MDSRQPSLFGLGLGGTGGVSGVGCSRDGLLPLDRRRYLNPQPAPPNKPEPVLLFQNTVSILYLVSVAKTVVLTVDVTYEANFTDTTTSD